jgi:integrase
VPAFDAEQITKLVADSEGEEQMLYIILASTGLRIGECLGLEVRHVLNDGRTLFIERAVNRWGKLAGLKTRAAKRHVDVSSDVAALINEYIKDKSGLLFATANGKPHLVGNLRTRWLQERFPEYGFHSFRRYRVTHLEAVRAHGHLTKVWTGHALSGVTEQYAESLKKNATLRLAETEKVGTGFAIPAPSCSKISAQVEVAQAA